MPSLTARIALALIVCAWAQPLRAQDQRPVPTAVWAPKPAQTAPYPPGQKPWIQLPDLKAKHKGETNWHEVIVDDGRLTGAYEAAAPGTKVAKRLHPDTREWFAVVEGEVRVEIVGQPALTATRGSVVNIPRQTIYSLETIGDKPSLRFMVNPARVKTLFPRESQEVPAPPTPAGSSWVPATLNIHEAASKNEKYSGGRFVRDDKSEMLIIYGYEKNLPPLDPNDKGHFHAESAEFWLVFTGQIRYSFEGQQPFVASEGDIVYVPAGTWHATRFTGAEPSCRLSITEYVGNALLLPPRP